jgi:hypothetical protein
MDQHRQRALTRALATDSDIYGHCEDLVSLFVPLDQIYSSLVFVLLLERWSVGKALF